MPLRQNEKVEEEKRVKKLQTGEDDGLEKNHNEGIYVLVDRSRGMV